MTIATVSALGTLTAAKVNEIIAAVNGLSGVPAYKTVDETVNNSAALQNDDELAIALEASARYILFLQAYQNSGATPGFKYDFTLPAGTTWNTGWFECGSSAANEQMGLQSTSANSGVTGAGADSIMIVRAVITTSTTPGTGTWRWAQNTANASNTIVRAGSSLLGVRIA